MSLVPIAVLAGALDARPAAADNPSPADAPRAAGVPPFLVEEAGLRALGATLATARTPGARLRALVDLAWQLRQRDTARAAALAAEAEALVATLAPSDTDTGAHARPDADADADADADPDADADADADADRGTLRARARVRLALVAGEGHWLAGRLGPAGEAAAEALRASALADDDAGRADAHWLRAMIAIDEGDWPAMDAQLEAMAAAAAPVDADRVLIAQAAQAYFDAFRATGPARARWDARLADGASGRTAAAGCWAEDYLAVCAHHAGDFVPAVRHFVAAHTLALASGQPRRAVIAATNTGDSLNHLNDYAGALEWMERGLALARQSGGPGAMGVALLQTAHTLRLLKRLDDSREMLREALALMAPLAASRNYAYALWQLSEVELAAGDFPRALDACLDLGRRADALGQADLRSSARCGEARARLALGQPAEALAAARAALSACDGAPNLQIAALRVLADIHAAHPSLPPPEGMTAATPALHYLQRALAMAADIEGFLVPPALLEAVAREHARRGEFRLAYEFGQRAAEARDRLHDAETANRAVAMHVTHQTDRARAEADHQRRLARANAERIETLELIGAVGREITRTLEPADIYAALDRLLPSLLDVASLVVYRVSADGGALESAFGSAGGRPVAPHRTALDAPDCPAARCAREEREVLAGAVAGPGTTTGPDGTAQPALRSLLSMPLKVADRLIGVVTIQSTQPGAYAGPDVAVLRTLSAYLAIALANADVRAELVAKNRQLEALSVRDPLTGLFNRLKLDQVLAEERLRRTRGGTPMSVILLDLDFFKAVNDLHGHPAGDQVLVTVGALLRAGSREIDVAGRWGGEEFLVVCRETALDGAVVLAHKLRAAIAAQDFPVIGHLTASFGVATLRADEDVPALMSRADVALYRAKALGRNRVEAARDAH